MGDDVGDGKISKSFSKDTIVVKLILLIQNYKLL